MLFAKCASHHPQEHQCGAGLGPKQSPRKGEQMGQNRSCLDPASRITPAAGTTPITGARVPARVMDTVSISLRRREP